MLWKRTRFIFITDEQTLSFTQQASPSTQLSPPRPAIGDENRAHFALDVGALPVRHQARPFRQDTAAPRAERPDRRVLTPGNSWRIFAAVTLQRPGGGSVPSRPEAARLCQKNSRCSGTIERGGPAPLNRG